MAPAQKRRRTGESTSSSQVKVAVPTTAKVFTEAQTKAYIAKVLKQRGLNAPEVKFRISVISGQALSAGGSVDCLCVVDQGTDDFNRIGDKIGIKSLEIRGFISSGAAFTYDQCTMAVWVDKQINGAATPMNVNIGSTVAAPFFYYNAGAPGGSAVVPNRDWSERFVIKSHKQVHANQQFAAAPYQVSNFTTKITWKTPLVVEYSTGAATVAAVSTNGLMFGYSNISGGNTTISYIAEITYVDV